MYSANATMRAKFRIHFRYTRQRNTTFTQLYHPAQKLEQRQKRLARALNAVVTISPKGVTIRARKESA